MIDHADICGPERIGAVARHLNVDILQVVLACAADANEAGEVTVRQRPREQAL